MLKNIFYLGGVQVANLLFPLILIPFLSRKLGPQSLGQLAVIQSLFLTLSILIEYGFAFSATRKLAAIRDDPEQASQLVSDVLGAKMLLTLLYVLIAAIIYLSSPVFREHPLIYIIGIFFGIAQGMAPLWFFQGMESLRLPATIDVIAKSITMALTLVFVSSPTDNWKVILLQTLGFLLALIASHVLMYRMVKFRLPHLQGSWLALREGGSMFTYKIIVSAYTTLNATILRFFVPAAQVAYYSNADRMVSVGKSMIGPVTQVVFPRIASLIRSDWDAARRLFLKSLFLLTGISLMVTLVLFTTAHWTVPKFLGEKFIPSVPVFQTLCWSIPFVSISAIVGFSWLIPNKMDRIFNGTILTGALFNLAFVFYSVPRFGYKSMAWAVVWTEFLIATILVCYTFMFYIPSAKIKETR